jgi:hypothetical protein
VKFRLTLAALLLATSAFAEDAPAIPPTPEKTAPAATAAPQRYYLEIDQSDLAALSQALNELPKRIADPLLLKFNGQLQAQEQLKAAADKSLVDATEKAKKRK